MTRSEIISRFRQEFPEFTANSLATSVLNSWCLEGDKEVCAKARLIVDSTTIDAVADQARYDLTNITNFYDIDELPGGGISYVDTSGNEKRLEKTTKALLDRERKSWRTASSGTPKYYYRRGKYLYMYPEPSSSIDYFNVDFICKSDDFDDDNKEPYNQLPYLETFHYAIVLYLAKRAKGSRGKAEEAQSALSEYESYVTWMKKEIGGGKYGPINLVPQGVTPNRERR